MKVSVLKDLKFRYDDLPIVGDEQGDRAEIERINGGTFALPIAQPTVISRDLPVGDPWLAMRLNLRGQLRDPGVPATGVVVPDAPLGLFSVALRTDLDGDVVESNVSARALYRYNQFMNQNAGQIVAAVLPNTNTTLFSAFVEIPFVDRRLFIPFDSILDTRRYNSVTLTVTVGAIADVVNTPAATTVLEACFVDIEIVRVSPRMPLPTTVAKLLPVYKQHAAIVPPADTVIDLDRIPTHAIKRILTFVSNGVAGPLAPIAGVPFTGAGVDNRLDTLRISSNYRDHFGGTNGGVSWRTIQPGNMNDYNIAAWPPGWYVSDFMLEQSLFNALATGDKSTLRLIAAYQGAGANVQQLSAFVAGMKQLVGAQAA